MDLSLSDIEKAAERISSIALKTPIITARTFSKECGGEIMYKAEILQRTGSFKIRGASNKIAKMVENNDYSPVVASSAGNHAQGVAIAAAKFGIQSTIVMPESAPLAKISATKGYGANVILCGKCYDDSHAKSLEICSELGAKYIDPYDDLDVIAGQGTIGLEIMEQVPDVDIILVPAGGGGLLSGVATAVKAINPNVKVIGVQAENADAIYRSFHEKKRVCTDSAYTIADGIAVKNPGINTIELINKYVDDVVTVSENNIFEAIVFLAERSKLLVEGAGAVPVAAILWHKIDIKGKKVICILSGGNIDIKALHELLKKGLFVRSRLANILIEYPERECNISDIINTIIERNGKILTLNVDIVDTTIGFHRVFILCEVGDKEHLDDIVVTLQSIGCKVLLNQQKI